MRRLYSYIGKTKIHALNALAMGKSGVLLSVTFVEASRIKAKSLAAAIQNGAVVSVTGNYMQKKSAKYVTLMKPVLKGRETVVMMSVMNAEIGKRYLLTDCDHLEEDLHAFLMHRYHLPLLKEWMGKLKDALLDEGAVKHPIHATGYTAEMRESAQETDEDTGIVGVELHGRNIPAEKVLVYDFGALSEETLRDTVSDLIKKGEIVVSKTQSKPLEFNDFDEYITRYGASLVENLESGIETLSPLKGDVDGFVAKTKRLYPQQAACINGITALKRAGSKYGMMVEGMGCGKTLQGAAVVEAYSNQNWLTSHPGKDLKDLFLAEDKPCYRNLLMAPSHLVHKWKEEVEKEIPGASCIILKDLEQLAELKKRGRKRTGKEWYLISKDFAKLGTQLIPVPTTVKSMIPCAPVCADCYQEDGTISYKNGAGKGGKCDKCGGRHFMPHAMTSAGKVRGLTCPSCNQLLLKYSSKYYEKSDAEGGLVLKPEDFATHKAVNDFCYVCGESLWTADVKPMGTVKPKKWYKITHWRNFQHRGRVSAFVLKGHETEYYAAAAVEQEGVEVTSSTYGPRRVAPAHFIKKYLKGYFDFCVLDEAHKYEHGGTAQATAAHALMRASAFTLCLTGTLSNGRADSFFYLLYMLDPARMRAKGFTFSDCLEFSRRYGSVETIYEAEYEGDGRRNTTSRGKQLSSPRVKPGISPLLFVDFLIDKAVFLDLSDLSKYLPPLKEQVVACACPEDVSRETAYTLNSIKEALKRKGGRSLLSTLLQFGLSYPDKPYGVPPIMHPAFRDVIVAAPKSLAAYSNGKLLPKEEKLVEIVRSEVSENRNVFIYCAYTGSAEKNVLERLKSLVEVHCNLSGQVLVMRAETPKASDREAYIKRMAVTEGVRVFICNMKLVETGLDFCGAYEGMTFNYPTIIFYQMTYELSVMWQASRRHYRLNQTEECRTYYLCTEGTLQMAAVQIMAEKQVAASAIQGKFSADGLAAMANGVDPRLKLAQMLAESDMSDRKSLENMFDVMNAGQNDVSDDARYGSYEPPKTYYELMEDTYEEATEVIEVKPVLTKEDTAGKTEPAGTQFTLFEIAELFRPLELSTEDLLAEKEAAGKGKRVPKQMSGQISLIDVLAA